MSIGASRFGGTTSPAGARCRRPSIASCSSTTTNARIAAIACVGARLRPSSKGRWLHEPVEQSVNTFTKLDNLGLCLAQVPANRLSVLLRALHANRAARAGATKQHNCFAIEI